MNARALGKAIALCSMPPAIGFLLGTLPVDHPRLFITMAAGIVIWLGYLNKTQGAVFGDLTDLDKGYYIARVAAAALLCVSFHFSFWTALAYSADLGILRPGVVIATSTAVLAAIALWVGRVPVRTCEKHDDIVRSGLAPLPTSIRGSLGTPLSGLVTQANRSTPRSTTVNLPRKSQ